MQGLAVIFFAQHNWRVLRVPSRLSDGAVVVVSTPILINSFPTIYFNWLLALLQQHTYFMLQTVSADMHTFKLFTTILKQIFSAVKVSGCVYMCMYVYMLVAQREFMQKN